MSAHMSCLNKHRGRLLLFSWQHQASGRPSMALGLYGVWQACLRASRDHKQIRLKQSRSLGVPLVKSVTGQQAGVTGSPRMIEPVHLLASQRLRQWQLHRDITAHGHVPSSWHLPPTKSSTSERCGGKFPIYKGVVLLSDSSRGRKGNTTPWDTR